MSQNYPANVGPFRVTGVLGHGAMGWVLLGLHPSLGYEVAIKVLHAGRSATDVQRTRFQREVEALSKLQHPGLARILKAGEEQGADHGDLLGSGAVGSDASG